MITLMQTPAIAPPRHGTQSQLPPPSSALGDTAESFPFSVAGGLRRRLERHYELYGTEAVVERFDYKDLRGKPQPVLRHEPRAVLHPPTPELAPPVVLPQVTQPEIKAAAPPPAAPATSSVAPAAPAAPATPKPEPGWRAVAPAAPIAPATPKPEPGWRVVEPKPFALNATPPATPAAQVSAAWHVIDAPANLPAVTPDWNIVDLPGVLTKTTTPEAEALTELSKTGIRTVIINAAIWATVLTAIFAAIEAIAGHH